MDTVLVSRVRILYLRSLLSRSPELQSIKVLKVLFLSKLPLASDNEIKLFGCFFTCRFFLLTAFWRKPTMDVAEAPAEVAALVDLRHIMILA